MVQSASSLSFPHRNYFSAAVLEDKKNEALQRNKQLFLNKLYKEDPTYLTEGEPTKKFHSQIRALVEELKKHISDQDLIKQCDEITNVFDRAEQSSQEIKHTLCITGKDYLESFVYEIQKMDNTLLIEKELKTITSNLACTPGFITDLQSAYGAVSEGCNEILRQERLVFVRQKALEYIHKLAKNINEIELTHYATALTNFIATEFDIPRIADAYSLDKFSEDEKEAFKALFFTSPTFIENLMSCLIARFETNIASISTVDQGNSFLEELRQFGELDSFSEKQQKEKFFNIKINEKKPEKEEKGTKQKEVKEKEVKQRIVDGKEVNETNTLVKPTNIVFANIRCSIAKRLLESKSIQSSQSREIKLAFDEKTHIFLHTDHLKHTDELKTILDTTSADVLYILEERNVSLFLTDQLLRPSVIKKQLPNVEYAYVIYKERLYFYNNEGDKARCDPVNVTRDPEERKAFFKEIIVGQENGTKDFKKIDITKETMHKLQNFDPQRAAASKKIYYLNKTKPDELQQIRYKKPEDFDAIIETGTPKTKELGALKEKDSTWKTLDSRIVFPILEDKTSHSVREYITVFPKDFMSSYVQYQNDTCIPLILYWLNLSAEKQYAFLRALFKNITKEEQNDVMLKYIFNINPTTLARLVKIKEINPVDILLSGLSHDRFDIVEHMFRSSFADVFNENDDKSTKLIPPIKSLLLKKINSYLAGYQIDLLYALFKL